MNRLKERSIHFDTGTVFLVSALVFTAACTISLESAAQDATVTTQPAATLTSRAPYRLIYDHIDGSITLESSSGRVKERWDRHTATSPLAEIPPKRPVAVIIRNANPLLYDYLVDAEVVRVEELKPCRNILSRFFGQGFLVTAASVGSAALSSFGLSSIPTSSALDLGAVFSELRARGTSAAVLTEAGLQRQMNLIEGAVSSYADYTSDVAGLAGTVRDSLVLFASQGESVPLGGLVDRFQQSLEAIQPGLSDPARVPVLVAERTREVSGALATLGQLARKIEQDMYNGAPTDFEAVRAIRLRDQIDLNVARLQSSLPQLQADLLRLERVKSQTERVFTLGPSEGAVRRLVIESRSNGQYPNVFRLHEGRREVYTRPRTRIECQISVGLAWLDPQAEYEIDFADSMIVNANREDFRLAPSLLMHLSLSSVPILGANFGLGIGKHRLPDFYVGGSVRLFEPVLFNAGLVWQRVRQLPDDLSEGIFVEDPQPDLLDDLDLKFERSVFFSVSIGR